jgi:hypothetical protein
MQCPCQLLHWLPANRRFPIHHSQDFFGDAVASWQYRVEKNWKVSYRLPTQSFLFYFFRKIAWSLFLWRLTEEYTVLKYCFCFKGLAYISELCRTKERKGCQYDQEKEGMFEPNILLLNIWRWQTVPTFEVHKNAIGWRQCTSVL